MKWVTKRYRPNKEFPKKDKGYKYRGKLSFAFLPTSILDGNTIIWFEYYGIREVYLHGKWIVDVRF